MTCTVGGGIPNGYEPKPPDLGLCGPLDSLVVGDKGKICE